MNILSWGLRPVARTGGYASYYHTRWCRPYSHQFLSRLFARVLRTRSRTDVRYRFGVSKCGRMRHVDSAAAFST